MGLFFLDANRKKSADLVPIMHSLARQKRTSCLEKATFPFDFLGKKDYILSQKRRRICKKV